MLNNTSVDAQNTDKILKEFKVGDKLLQKVNTAITIYGSARTKRNNKYYDITRDICEKLAGNGFDIISGGGPGIMQAANEGAFMHPEVKSVALGIKLPFETSLNQYHNLGYTFKYFFTRKVMMVKYSVGYVIMPGGVGTLDELFETLTLIQTSKNGKGKVYLIGVEYYEGLLTWMKNHMLEDGYISEDDLDMIVLTDDIDMVVKELTTKFIN